jgi:serine/threonine protein kinase
MEGLNFLHENGIVHGDLNLRNIMINQSNNHVTLIDFGLSVITYNSDGTYTKLDGYSRFSPLE